MLVRRTGHGFSLGPSGVRRARLNRLTRLHARASRVRLQQELRRVFRRKPDHKKARDRFVDLGGKIGGADILRQSLCATAKFVLPEPDKLPVKLK